VPADTAGTGTETSRPPIERVEMARGTLGSRQLPRAFFPVLACAALLSITPAARATDNDPWIARDKALHFDACAGIAALGYALSAGWVVDARWKALAVGGGIAMAAGAGKELLDATHVLGGDPSWKDFAWDAIGTLAGLAVAWGVDLLLGGVSRERPSLAAPMPASSQGALTVSF
jgi:uncharacterized protein YfiM (DUF2279 family)